MLRVPADVPELATARGVVAGCGALKLLGEAE